MSSATRHLLDTTFLIDVMRGDLPARARLMRIWAEADAIYVNEVVLCEFFSGLKEPDVVPGLALVEPLEFVRPGPDSARMAGRWRRSAAQAGRSLSVGDALIAAAAQALGATVLTRNVRDFALTPVPVESY